MLVNDLEETKARSPGMTGKWIEKVLYSFQSGIDGSHPWAGIVFDASGNIYGTTTKGGNSGAGTVFELVAPVGTGGYKEKVSLEFQRYGRKSAAWQPDSGQRRQPLWHDQCGRIEIFWRRVRSKTVGRSSTNSFGVTSPVIVAHLPRVLF